MTEEPLFDSTHSALVFAFNFTGQQSPKTPMMSMFHSNPGDDQPKAARKGKGLSGLDGAAQAGFILAEVCRLPDDQHNVIVARYNRLKNECKCCGHERYNDEWFAAVDFLSHCVELEGVHRKVRLMMVEVAICGGRIDVDMVSRKYSMGRSTTYRQLAELKIKLRKIEKIALINLDNAFSQKKLLVA